MAFYGQNPLQYLPQPQSQHGNAIQPPFGPGPYSAHTNAPTTFNDPPLPVEHGAFSTNELTSTSAQNYDQPQNTGFLRGLSGQLTQLEQRLEGRFQEIRLRTERVESSVVKLENRLERIDTSITSISKSLQSLTKDFSELDMRAERSADDAYAAITVLIEITTRQLQTNMTELTELQQYQQRGERQF